MILSHNFIQPIGIFEFPSHIELNGFRINSFVFPLPPVCAVYFLFTQRLYPRLSQIWMYLFLSDLAFLLLSTVSLVPKFSRFKALKAFLTYLSCSIIISSRIFTFRVSVVMLFPFCSRAISQRQTLGTPFLNQGSSLAAVLSVSPLSENSPPKQLQYPSPCSKSVMAPNVPTSCLNFAA